MIFDCHKSNSDVSFVKRKPHREERGVAINCEDIKQSSLSFQTLQKQKNIWIEKLMT